MHTNKLRQSAVLLGTPDVSDTMAFYTERLGFTVLGKDWAETNELAMVILERDYVLLQFHKLKPGAVVPRLSEVALSVGDVTTPDAAFGVDSLGQFATELRRAGVTIKEERNDTFMKQIVVEDNNGYRIAFFEY